jgi:hypothetical protein
VCTHFLAARSALEERDEDALGEEDTRAQVGDGMPTRTGPWPGMPVMDMRPPILRDLIDAGRSRYGPSCPKPEMLP